MKIKTLLSAMASVLAIGSLAAQTEGDNKVIMLDLSKSTTPLTFDEVNGMWSDNFCDDATEIESQVFSIVHGSVAEWNYWYGFTASNSTDNSYQSNVMLYQYSNMAKGGILLTDNGEIKLNSFKAPMTGAEMPYLVAFPKSEIIFNTGKTYEPIGAYVNLNSYTYYCLLYGDAFARAFTEGDKLTLTIHGVDEDENEKSLDFTLASYSNGSLSACTGWAYVDLTALGEVNEIYFTMSSTDSGEYGMNTPGYFCLDKLMVKEVSGTSGVVMESLGGHNSISYDRINKDINLENEDFAVIYDAAGKIVMTSTESKQISVAGLEPGVYVVKSGNERLKFAR